jgi:RND family efflux transporter MFP subunit
MTTDESIKTTSAASPETKRVTKPDAPAKKKSSSGVLWIVAIVVLIVLGVGIFEGIHSRTQAETALEQTTKQDATPFVNVVYPTSGSAGTDIQLPGSTQAFTDTPIYARTSGYLKKWYADIGTRVKQGQLLAEIETPELDQQLQQAQADLKNAQANLNISQITNGRYAGLLASNSVSKQEADQAASDLNSKQALVDSAQANMRRLQDLQAFEKLYAPFDGVITARNTDIGALIQAGDNTTPKELFHLSDISKLRVYIAVPEVYADRLKSGQKVGITLDSFPGETFEGTLVRNSNAIDPQSRTLNVEVDVDNSAGRLLPGGYAFVHLSLPSHGGAVTIPANTLLFRAEGLRVGVVHNGHVKLTLITIGHDYGGTVEVVSGLTTQDAVILDPADSLTDGATVQVTEPAKK